jgi:cytochrome P450 enzyme
MTILDSPSQIPVLHFDPNAPGFTADPHPTWTEVREQAPVHYWPEANAYVLSRFDDVAQMLRDPRMSTDSMAAGQPPRWQGMPEELVKTFERSLFNLDPKDHARVRRAVSPAFTPRAIERLRPQIQRLVDEALVPFEGQAEIDVAEFADFVPLRVIALMLGIPPEHEETFRSYGEANVKLTALLLSDAERAAVYAAILPGMKVIRSLIAERRRDLGDDLLSTLIRAEEAGDRLSEDEMLSLVSSLITGGSETTVHLICFAVKSLLCVPERVAEVRADPTLLRSAMEELLRFDSFGKGGVMRYATEDLEIGGARIKRGSLLFGFLSAAQRDPRAFPDADRFDARRQPAENLSFGMGMHFCLGASLARIEGDVAIGTLLDRYAEMRLVAEPTYAPHPLLRKLTSLRVGVTPRARGVAGAP